MAHELAEPSDGRCRDEVEATVVVPAVDDDVARLRRVHADQAPDDPVHRALDSGQAPRLEQGRDGAAEPFAQPEAAQPCARQSGIPRHDIGQGRHRAGLEQEDRAASDRPFDVDRRAIDGLDLPDEVRHLQGGDRVDGADRLASEPGSGRSDGPVLRSCFARHEPISEAGDRAHDRRGAIARQGIGTEGDAGRFGRDHALDQDGHLGRRCRRLFMMVGRHPIAPAARADHLDGGDDRIDPVHAEDGLVHPGKRRVAEVLDGRGRPDCDRSCEAGELGSDRIDDVAR